MSDYTLIGECAFTAEIFCEGSWGATSAGTQASHMALYFGPSDHGTIEWTIDAIEVSEEIGLWFEPGPDGKRILVDYDGVMTLPEQAIHLLEQHGVYVSEEFH